MTFRFCFVVIVISGSIAIVGCGSGSSNSTSKSADLEQADIAANLAKLPDHRRATRLYGSAAKTHSQGRDSLHLLLGMQRGSRNRPGQDAPCGDQEKG
jgi:hypothetical protein